MNSNLRKDKKHFNFIDIILIIVLIAFLAFAANIIITDVFNYSNSKIEYVIRITGVDNSDIEKIQIGNKLTAGDTNAFIGSVHDIKAYNSVVTVFNENNLRFVSTEVSGKSDLYLTVTASAEFEENRYIVNGINICANNHLPLTVPFRCNHAEIVSVKLINDMEEVK